jgi:valyl-tRNA synthetase
MVLSLASLLSEREGVTLYIEYKVEKKRSKNQKPKTPPQTTTLLVLPHPLRLLHAVGPSIGETLETERGT